MKKILAIAMAIVMMMAIAVPAFAGEISVSGNSGDTEVKVAGSTATSSFLVEIPAEVNLNWGNNGTGTYKITSQLETGKVVKVGATVAQVLTSATNETIVFTLAGDVTDVKAASEVVNEEAHNFEVVVAADAWAAASIADYVGKITFTAEVVAA